MEEATRAAPPSSAHNGAAKLVTLGRACGVFGVRGSLKVASYTSPPENILLYRRWHLQRRTASEWVAVEQGRPHGRGVVVDIAGIDDRDKAAGLVGATVAVHREQLAPLPPGDHYWTDLEGLQVRHRDGRILGVVDYILETGAHDVLVVRGKRERLIPYVEGEVVLAVHLHEGVIRVDWDPAY